MMGGNSNSNSSSSHSTTATATASPKRLKGEELRSPRTTTALSETSRDRTAVGAGPKARVAAPPNNRSIHDFFSSNNTNKKPSSATTTSANYSHNPWQATSVTPLDATPQTNAISVSNTATATTIDWQAKCNKLQQLLQDRDEQLKAVTNNKTILHTALQAALEKTKQELAQTKSKVATRDASTSKVLEDLLRWKSNQQAKDLREKLATDGARLGRIVYARAGMRALESWEEGYATKDLETRKQALSAKRTAVEKRSAALQDKDKENQSSGSSSLESIEARESLRMHLSNLKEQEAELAREEQALNDEKGAHIRALKRVASEDASRFRSRPKVCIIVLYVPCCLSNPKRLELTALSFPL
jgi:hypothetical protein